MVSDIKQTILLPFWDTIPKHSLAYAKILSEAYNKPISLLKLGKKNSEDYSDINYHIIYSNKKLTEAIIESIEQQDSVIVVWQYERNSRQIQAMLNACRSLRIPYFFVTAEHAIKAPEKILLPMSFLIEDREKATWGRSLNIRFGSEFFILKPNDKGTRAAKNVSFIEDFFKKNNIPHKTIQGKKSSFKIDKEASDLYSMLNDLIIVTASREYGLDDQFFGPKERNIIKNSNTPVMLLNPRGDLYVLCGD